MGDVIKETIADVEGAVIDYLEDQILIVIGNGNYTVSIYRGSDGFPHDAESESIVVYAELREGDAEAIELQPTATRITVRARKRSDAFELIKNVDKIFHAHWDLNLNDDVNLCYALRNAGPDWYPGDSDGLHYYTALYDSKYRIRL